ncbi:adhesin, partial [Paraburkholderia graminis]
MNKSRYEVAGTPLKSKLSLAVLTALMLLPATQAYADNLAVGGENAGQTATVGGATAPVASTGGVFPAVAGADGTSQNTAVGINVSAQGGAATALGDTVTANG